MTINLRAPEMTELKPRITVLGVGGAGGNAVNNMIASKLEGVEFVVANTDAQSLVQSKATRKIQMGARVTGGTWRVTSRHVEARPVAGFLAERVDERVAAWMSERARPRSDGKAITPAGSSRLSPGHRT